MILFIPRCKRNLPHGTRAGSRLTFLGNRIVPEPCDRAPAITNNLSGLRPYLIGIGGAEAVSRCVGTRRDGLCLWRKGVGCFACGRAAKMIQEMYE